MMEIFTFQTTYFLLQWEAKNFKIKQKKNQIESCLVQYDWSLLHRSSLGDASEALSEGFLGLSPLAESSGIVLQL